MGTQISAMGPQISLRLHAFNAPATTPLFLLPPKFARLRHSSNDTFLHALSQQKSPPSSHAPSKLSSVLQPHPTASTNNEMSQTQNSHSSATSPSPNLPRRQRWNTDDILCMGDDYTYADAAKEIVWLWNEWADSAEDVLCGIIDQMEEVDVSYDDYLDFVRQLASYPARPALPAAAADAQNTSDRPLSGVWNEWADVVERIVDEMKRAVDRSVPLPREQRTLCAGRAFDFSLDLSNQDPPPMHMAAHLREMLRDGTVSRDELAEFMEDLSL